MALGRVWTLQDITGEGHHWEDGSEWEDVPPWGQSVRLPREAVQSLSLNDVKTQLVEAGAAWPDLRADQLEAGGWTRDWPAGAVTMLCLTWWAWVTAAQSHDLSPWDTRTLGRLPTLALDGHVSDWDSGGLWDTRGLKSMCTVQVSSVKGQFHNWRLTLVGTIKFWIVEAKLNGTKYHYEKPLFCHPSFLPEKLQWRLRFIPGQHYSCEKEIIPFKVW